MACLPLLGLLIAGCMQSGTLAPSSDANFTARDRQQLANPPYRRAWISPTYQRQIVQFHRKEAPGSVVVETSGPFVYYVLPGGKAIRYGAIVGEAGMSWSGVATVGRKEEQMRTSRRASIDTLSVGDRGQAHSSSIRLMLMSPSGAGRATLARPLSLRARARPLRPSRSGVSPGRQPPDGIITPALSFIFEQG